MADLGFVFNKDEVEKSEFEALPSAEYLAAITDSSIDDNSKKTGRVLKLVFTVLEGQYKNRKIFNWLNVVNTTSDKAQLIARQELEKIQEAAGIDSVISDSCVLHNRPMIIRVEFLPANPDGVGKDQRKYDTNKIREYKKISDDTPAVSKPQQAASSFSWPT